MNKLTKLALAVGLLFPTGAWAAEQLPYTTEFATEAEFNAWTSKAGADATVTTPWAYNEDYTRAEFDGSEYKKEDNYFISPALDFAEAGTYKVEMKYTAFGTMDIVLGTDIDDLTSFTTVLKKFEDISDFDETSSVSFEVAQAGTYYVAIHLIAESGSFMGYAINSVKVMADKAVPVLVEDLKAEADANDALKVVLTWTNPSKTTTDSDLQAITKVVVKRNGEEVATITEGLTPDEESTYTDTPTEAGDYSYSVVVYDANGCSADEPMEVSAGYVGKPMGEFPYSFTYSEYEPTLGQFTCLDADGDGTNFELDDSWWPTAFISTNDGTADNYLATPYIHLTPGYYLFSSEVEANQNSVEFGYATNRHDLTGTFVKCMEVLNFDKYSFNEFNCVLVIETEGDYCLVWHHVGTSGSSYYNKVKVKSASLESQPALPGVATDLTATAAPGEMDVVLTWINPSKDNGGQALQAIAKVEIMVGDEVVETLTEGLEPGMESTFTVTVEDSGILTFSVVVYNENGCSDEEAPSVTLFVGTGKKMPYTADFSEWTTINGGSTWDEWDVNGNGHAYYYGIFEDVDDAIHSPYLLMTAGNTYTVTFTTYGEDEDHAADFALHAGPESDQMVKVKDLAHSGTDEITHSVVLKPVANQAATLAEEDETVAAEEALVIPSGNVKLGFHINKIGQVYIKDFKVTENPNVTTGVENVITNSQASIFVNDGVVTFAEGMTDLVVADITGRVLYRATVAPAQLDLHSINAKGILIISAKTNAGAPATVKVAF